MKKFFATNQVRNLFMSLFFLFGFMVFGADKAAAQTVGQSGLNWVTEAQAATILKDALLFVKTNQLAIAIPGSCNYVVAEARYNYYSQIKTMVETGSTTELSTSASLGFLYMGGAQAAVLSVNAISPGCPVDSKAIYTEAVQLLTN